MLGAAEAALAAVIAVMLAQTVLRLPWYKVLFNAAVFALAAMATATIFHALAGPFDTADAAAQLAPVALAALGSYLVNGVLVAGVLTLSGATSPISAWRDKFLWAAPHYLALAFVAYAVAFTYRDVGAVAMIAFALPIAMMWLIMKQHTTRTRADIARLRTAKEALRLSEARYRAVVETSTRGIFSCDAGGAIHFHNQQFVATVGDDAPCADRSILDFVSAADRPAVEAALRTAPPQSRSLEVHLPTPQRGERLVNLTLRRYANSEDLLGEIDDITERRALESRVEQAQLMDSVGNLAAGISHDFNNPRTRSESEHTNAATWPSAR